MPTISVYLTDDEHSYVSDHDSKSGILRDALDEYRERHENDGEDE